jgi:hypothetical protein
MKNSRLNNKVKDLKNHLSDSKIKPEYEDLFKKSLEMALGRKVSAEEVKEMDEILSGRSSDDSYD